jgi:sodium-dependent dicarboxylate transporter 2/3/5
LAFLPEYPGLGEAGRWSLAIVIIGAGLWMTEAIPAFSVALLIIGLQFITLGRPGGPLLAAEDTRGWEMFVRPWASPPMWLFFGGLIVVKLWNNHPFGSIAFSLVLSLGTFFCWALASAKL